MLSAIGSWLAAPLFEAMARGLPPWIYWHARLMVLAWNVLLPLGMLAARFLKMPQRNTWPNRLDHKLWWRSHVALQCAGIGVMTAGALMVAGRSVMTSGPATLHHWLGWCLIGIGWIQAAGGTLRGTKGGPTAATLRGDHYDMTCRRILFEYLHKLGGWLTIPLVLAATALGLALANAPRWMAVLLTVWWLALGAAFFWLQRAGFCVDTYQAIWGADPSHPGNARAPIGWGVRRLGSAAAVTAATIAASATSQDDRDG